MQASEEAPDELRISTTPEITRKHSNSNHCGEFQHWFCMPFRKVEELTNILIDHDYINSPRSHRRRAVFRERSEFLVISRQYLLGKGDAFCEFSRIPDGLRQKLAKSHRQEKM
jgi:hypothetical protein